jgi:integrase
MTSGEIKTLLNTTENGPDRTGMTGPTRALLYRLACETGLRASELAALKESDFDLAGRTVTLAAVHTKNKKGASLPLRVDTVERLRAFLAGKLPGAGVFNMPRIEHVSKIVKADLTAAGIDPADDGSGKLDFHSLRHSFASLLIQSGVDVKTAQNLLRHSTPGLTLQVYTHTLRGSEQAAVDRLPGFDSGPETERQKATGTDGKAVESAPILLTTQLTKNSDFFCKQVSFSGISDKSKPVIGEEEKTPLTS